MKLLQRLGPRNNHKVSTMPLAQNLSRFRAVLFIAILNSPVNALAENVQLRFEIELPPQCRTQTVFWGLQSGMIGLATGELQLNESAPAKNRGMFISHVVVDLDANELSKAKAILCLNGDRLLSHMPSFGDLFQRVAPIQTEEAWRIVAKKDGWSRRTTIQDDSILTIHYHRFDDNYRNASLWTWDSKHQRQPDENELLPVGRDDFGLVFQLDTTLYGSENSGIGLLPRRNGDWQFKDGGDRNWSPEAGRDIYIIQGENSVYKARPGLQPAIRRVTLDAPKMVAVFLSRPGSANDWPADRFSISNLSGEMISVSSTVLPCDSSTCTRFLIVPSRALSLADGPFRLHLDKDEGYPIEIGEIQKDPKIFFDPDVPLGHTYSSTQSLFSLFSPTATAAWVVVANEVSGPEGTVEYSMEHQGKGIWKSIVCGDLEGKYYAYKVEGWGLDKNREITDPYSRCTQGRHPRTLMFDEIATAPEDRPFGSETPEFSDQPLTGTAIIYELHVRDFTIDRHADVLMAGQYSGLSESGRRLISDASIATGLDHLVELGVTHVQIMPIQDFDNDETDAEAYNWGYMPIHFNSPDGVYASDPMGDAKIREVRQMVDALHARGIRVILDVVYNHTSSKSSFDQIAPGYYYRFNDDGSYSNGSGCGNEFDSEAPMGRRFIVDSCKYWMQYYGFDGFRFDLMGLIDLETMQRVKSEVESINPSGMVYGEPWTGGATTLNPVTDKQRVAGTGIGAFNDHFRDAIKGGRDGGGPGFIQNGDRAEGVIKGIAGSIDDWTKNPSDSINYFAAHDNLTAWDKVLQSVPDASDAERRRMMRFAALILFTSQGHVFMHSGQEMCRTKQGNHNSYNQPDSINMIDWQRKKEYLEVFEYNRAMIAIRKAHPVFQLKTADDVRKRVRISKSPTDRCIVYRIDGRGLAGEIAHDVLVLLNGESNQTEFKLPPGEWSVHADADSASLESMRSLSGRALIPAHSGMLLTR